ncbi:uncharacterized protein BP5553_09265 [Venustampulla echinocandica]|uniref:Uncharacterized protein n=1 Tax=Venustampulla echinocandica TaxID=2656787 RepID=A0A370TC83_9HELO|nr:uncharacterized protein BP5553_09265 [Venustampulla echinocandica]RDL31863.1 hypothetical protein BP5553_09265 [Venustampulla echinocandica]
MDTPVADNAQLESEESPKEIGRVKGRVRFDAISRQVGLTPLNTHPTLPFEWGDPSQKTPQIANGSEGREKTADSVCEEGDTSQSATTIRSEWATMCVSGYPKPEDTELPAYTTDKTSEEVNSSRAPSSTESNWINTCVSGHPKPGATELPADALVDIPLSTDKSTRTVPIHFDGFDLPPTKLTSPEKPVYELDAMDWARAVFPCLFARR